MKTKTTHTDQQGFTIGTFLFVLLGAVLVFFVARYVMQTNRDNKEQAGKLQQALVGEDTPELSEDSQSIPDKPQSTAWEYPIKKMSVDVQALEVVFTAQLPGTYIGTCTVELDQVDGNGSYRFVEPLNSQKSCSVTVPRQKFKDSKQWSYVMGFYSKDGRSWGKYPKSTLEL